MLFNSYAFILVFLPVTLGVFALLGRRGLRRPAIAWLVAASLFFYGWWNPAYLLLILSSIAANHAVGRRLGRSPSKALLGVGVAANLGAIGYFKYANFLVGNVNALTGAGLHLDAIVLPLAISFFTFQQIAYLVDAYRGTARETSFISYCLFVTFFPQLIAGPIVRHEETLPQFADRQMGRVRASDLSVGVTIFFIGLAKKVVLADQMALYATPVFTAAKQGAAVTLIDAWGGMLAYTFQLYFDFSGYSDMAVGLGRMFGIMLPLNFNAPYKAANIIEFWRRWHMTLSRFLRDYLYIPLGGSRRGRTRQFVSLMATMLLGGLWHGAGWTFVLWGGLHGGYLIVNHGWRMLTRRLGLRAGRAAPLTAPLARLLTFLAVAMAWVLFRAESLDAAIAVYRGLFGLNGVTIPVAYFQRLQHIVSPLGVAQQVHFYLPSIKEALGWIVLCSGIAFLLPNTQQLMSRHRPGLETYPQEPAHWPWTRVAWRPNTLTAVALAALAACTLFLTIREAEFLYFQF